MMSSRRKPFSALLGLAAIGLMASGCANQTTSYRTQRVGGSAPMVITEDAKLRNVMIFPETDPRRTNQWRVCAEASPDVFSALSASGAADLGLNTRGAGTEARAQAAIAIAEAAATAERTQTINMLRESMYRTCERYMSGAIDQATFVVQAGRDWRMMIAILAIEQLTRTARPPSTVISAGATSANVTTSVDVAAQFRAATEAEQAAADRLNAAKAALPTACATITDANRATCEGPTRDVAVAQGDYDRAKHNRGVWEAMTQRPPPPNQSGGNTAAGPNSSGQGGGAPTETALRDVALVVGEIVRDAFDTDETQLFCLQMLSRGSGYEDSPQLLDQCRQYLTAKVLAERDMLLRRADLRSAGIREAIDARSLNIDVLRFLRGSTDAQYNADVAIIRETFSTFCIGLNRVACIAAVDEGALSGVDAAAFRQIIQQRITARGQP